MLLEFFSPRNWSMQADGDQPFVTLSFRQKPMVRAIVQWYWRYLRIWYGVQYEGIVDTIVQLTGWSVATCNRFVYLARFPGDEL